MTGFNSWHGSTLENPKGWDKNGNDRRFKVDMAGIAFNAVLTPRFTGPRYGYHETDIVEQTGVVELVRDGTRDTGTDGDLVRTGPTCPRLARDVLPSACSFLFLPQIACAAHVSHRRDRTCGSVLTRPPLGDDEPLTVAISRPRC